MSLAAPPTVDTGAPRPVCTSPEKTSAHTPSWTFGIEQIDQALPWAGLPSNGLHEIRPASHADSWAALGFALALLARRRTARGGILLWGFTERTAHEFGAPYAPGLSRFGIDPGALLMARARGGVDLAWVLEEGLKSRALDAVLGQGEAMPEATGKRLALAARTHRTPCLLIPDHRAGGLGPALTRWRVATAPSAPPPFNASAPGFPRWRLTLERCRHGPAGHEWTLEWQEAGRAEGPTGTQQEAERAESPTGTQMESGYDAYRFHLAAPLADRTATRDGGAGGAVAAGR